MSPKIDLELSLRSWSRALSTPAQKVFAAQMRMRAQGIPLRYGDPGVSYRPLVPPLASGWQVINAGGVNLVGAVLLAFPPDPTDERWRHPLPVLVSPAEFAAQALGVQLAYVEGLDDGWHRHAHSAGWLLHIQRGAYLDGYETGMETRFRATVLCHCGTRRFRPERVCPGCST